MNSETKRIGLLMVLWVARVLLNGKLSKDEQEQIETLRIHLRVVELEGNDE